jgi:hypothetical protein
MGKQEEIKINETVKISATHKGVFSALAAAQLQMGPALKDSSNPAFKSKYADLSSVMAACLPALNSNGIAVFQPTGEDEAGRFVRTILAHESGETIDCRVPLIVSKNDMQGYGSAVTYARRYGLMSMAGIAPEDDDGNAAAKAAPDPRPEFEACVATAIRGIGREATMESLVELWSDLQKRERAVAEDARVIKAKDAKKAEIANRRDDLNMDEVPY